MVATTRGRVLRAVGAFALGLALLAVLLSSVGVGRVFRHLRTADPRLGALGALSAVTAVLLWSEALRQLLCVGRQVSGLRYRAAFLTGDFTKQVLPMGHASGPAIMAYAVSRAVGIDYEETLAAITVADLLNLAVSLLLATAGLALVAVSHPETATDAVLLPLVVAVLGVFVVVVLLTSRRRLLTAFVRRAAAFCHATAGRVVGRLDRLLDPEQIDSRLVGYYATLDTVAADRSRVVLAGVLAVAGWVLFAFPLYTSALALGVALPVTLALFVVPVAGLATWFPVPGGLGGVEVAVAGALVGFLGVDVGTAAAVALLYRLCSYWTVVAVDGLAALGAVAFGR
ncbi:lysylphosphatidylglycerol synthase transmembrane domain-containing protein [Salinirubrum litoreum]|uniref:YbhN family protein n=1 Tax=Salinirubrum litoreum TaxID=1126234 RepID=A0ABD5R7B8_9EURY